MPPLPSKPKGPALIPQALVLTALAAVSCSSQPPRIGQPPDERRYDVRIGPVEPPRIGEDTRKQMPVRIGAEPVPTHATEPSPTPTASTTTTASAMPLPLPPPVRIGQAPRHVEKPPVRIDQ